VSNKLSIIFIRLFSFSSWMIRTLHFKPCDMLRVELQELIALLDFEKLSSVDILHVAFS